MPFCNLSDVYHLCPTNWDLNLTDANHVSCQQLLHLHLLQHPTSIGFTSSISELAGCSSGREWALNHCLLLFHNSGGRNSTHVTFAVYPFVFCPGRHCQILSRMCHHRVLQNQSTTSLSPINRRYQRDKYVTIFFNYSQAVGIDSLLSLNKNGIAGIFPVNYACEKFV